jgi:hypothetical protein
LKGAGFDINRYPHLIYMAGTSHEGYLRFVILEGPRIRLLRPKPSDADGLAYDVVSYLLSSDRWGTLASRSPQKEQIASEQGELFHNFSDSASVQLPVKQMPNARINRMN